jgi:hypothetical protein
VANPEHLAKLKEGVDAWNQCKSLIPAVDLGEADLSGANLSRANLSRADLYAANLSDADLSRAILAGANLSRVHLSRANLTGANLMDAYLRDTNLSWANLNAANLSDADLSRAILAGANLHEANLAGAYLHGANLRHANLSGANLVGANLVAVSFVETNLEGADLTGCRIYGISVWNARLDGATQLNLVITRDDEQAIQVDNLEVAQFIYLLLNNNRIRNVIDTIGKKAVLILGRFTPDRKAILNSIREALRHSGFLPILFDFEKPSTRDTQETIVTLAGLARFIIADISDPKSIPQELGSIVPTLPSVPVQPLLETGHEPWGMYDHIKRYGWVLPLVEYQNQQALLKDLELKVIVPAEAKAKELTQK